VITTTEFLTRMPPTLSLVERAPHRKLSRLSV
jgi:hypothetical protein